MDFISKQTSSSHAIYIHFSCHRLQFTSIQAAASVKEIRMFLEPLPAFEVFYYSAQKAEALEGIQDILCFSELMIM